MNPLIQTDARTYRHTLILSHASLKYMHAYKHSIPAPPCECSILHNHTQFCYLAICSHCLTHLIHTYNTLGQFPHTHTHKLLSSMPSLPCIWSPCLRRRWSPAADGLAGQPSIKSRAFSIIPRVLVVSISLSAGLLMGWTNQAS